MIQRIAQYLWLLLMILSAKYTTAQCATSREFIRQIDEINESTKTSAAKINQLSELNNKIKSCIPVTDSIYARAINRLGDLYRQTGDFEKSIGYTKDAIAINSSNKTGAERSYLVNSYYNLGLNYSLLYLFPESHACFDSCISIGLNYPSKKKIVFMAFEQKAFTYYTSGDYQKAIDVADQGILRAKNNDDSLIEAILLSQKAQSQLELSRLDEAKLNINRSLNVLLRAGMPEYLATAYSIYARLSELNKDKGPAINYYQKAFLLNKTIGNYGQCSRDLMNLGYFYDSELNNPKLAIDCLNKSIPYAVKAHDEYQLAGLYNNIGNVYGKQHKYLQALTFFQKGLNSLPIHFNDTAISANPSANDLKLIANDYFIITLLSNKAETLLDLFHSDNDTSHLEIALKTYEAADQSIDLMRWKQQGELSKFYWREKSRQVYEKAIRTCYYIGEIEKSYYFFEKSRAVLLSDQLNELDAKIFISATDRTTEQSLRIKLYSFNERLSQLNNNSPGYSDLKQELLIAQNNLEQFIKNLEIKYPLYYRYKYDNTITPLKTLKESLSRNQQTLLEFFTGDSLLYILVVSPGTMSLKIVPRKEYDPNVNTIISLCAAPGLLNQQYSLFSRASFALYKQLIEPLNISTERIIISSDEQIIPFEALIYDTLARNAFLIRKYSFSYSYTAGLATKENNSQKLLKDFLGIAPVNYQPYLQQQTLFGADNSLEKIKKTFANHSMITGADASKNAFLQKFANYRIVQVYSHAEADSIGKYPVLYLSDSALLLPQIQMQENLRTEMIVLSACKTTIGKNIRGAGIYSIARGFAAAGIPSTVTTLWEVDNQATFLLTEKFYTYIQLGYTKDEALQKAKIALLDDTDGMYSLPYYWASTIVLGNAAPISGLAGNSYFLNQKMVWIYVVTSIILFLAYRFFRFRNSRKYR
ncbi:MAG: CHAT domain-containing protein [Flavitalea sp.]